MRAFPLLIVASLSACIQRGGEDKADSDTPGAPTHTDVYEPDDTGDSADVVESDPPIVDSDTGTGDTGEFLPTNMAYGAEFAVDGLSALHGFTYAGTTYPPTFLIELYRISALGGLRSCVISYELDPAAFAYAGQIGADAALLSFLDAEGLNFGFVVRSGLYTATQSVLCGNLPPAYTTDLPAEALAVFSGLTPELYLGFTTDAPTSSIATWAAPGMSDTGPLDVAHLLGGKLRFPFTYTPTPGAAPIDYFDAGAIYAETDSHSALVFQTGTNLLTLKPAAESWVDDHPGAGFYRLVVANGWGFTLTP